MSIQSRVNLLKSRRTKIVATLGPASTEEASIERLLLAGVDVVRLNMSHGTHESHAQAFERVRRAAERIHRPVMVLVDLSGPKIRTGVFGGGGIELAPGETVTVTTRDVLGEPGLIPSQYPALATDVGPGDRLLLDDGQLELRVLRVEQGTEVVCEVTHGGRLTDNKGINLPGVHVSAPSLTAKDKDDARFAVELGADMLALSFVRQADDVAELRELVGGLGFEGGIISKIEKDEALQHFSAILEQSDGIMVARGDLGVELPPEMVPVAQDQLVHRARARHKPVIVATQMLDSMIRNPRPTRAEVSDVAQAVKSGTDAVMLSAETAIGAFPVQAVETLDRVIRHTEGYQWQQGAFASLQLLGVTRDVPADPGEAMALATSALSRDLLVRTILVLSRSGTSAREVSAARPAAPIVAVSHNERTCRLMNLYWGVIPVKVDGDDMDEPLDLGRRLARELQLAEPETPILVVQGFQDDPRTNQPTVTVLRV
jgi:pyruvate kinase